MQHNFNVEVEDFISVAKSELARMEASVGTEGKETLDKANSVPGGRRVSIKNLTKTYKGGGLLQLWLKGR